MSLIDFILNLAGLLLWVNWRSVPHDPLATATPATLAGTLRRAAPARVKRWHFLAALASLLVLRAFFYRAVGTALSWTGQLDVVATRLSFPSDFLQWMLLYSALSFALALFTFFLWLMLISLLDTSDVAEALPTHLARVQLGPLHRWPKWLGLALPFVAGTLLWWSVTWPLAKWGLIPRPVSELDHFAQSALVGLGAYLAWKYLLAALLILHLLNNHIYFGRHPMWSYVNVTARRVLVPLRWLPLQVGRVDFAPLAGLVLIFFVAHIAEQGLALFGGYRVLGLAEMYRNLSR
ncbi:MAG: hypothetical protein EXS24_07020 [Pedosphaera sp.]|nr:hypothetical protein [Pedosphaera sp.]